MTNLTSKPFNIGARAYMNKLSVAWASANWLWFVLPLAAVAVWAFYDLRAVYVGLIILFLIYPAALTFVWFNYALSPDSLKALAVKTLSIDDKNLTINYLDKEDLSITDRVETMTLDKILNYETSASYVTLILGKKIDEKLMIPTSAFSDEEWQRLFDLFSSRNIGVETLAQ